MAHREGFENLCQRLAENDPNLTYIGEVTDLNDASAIRFGNSLRGNTNVTGMYLEVNIGPTIINNRHIEGIANDRSIEGIANFFSSSQSLVDIRFRFEPSAFADRILHAIARNHHQSIQKLEIGGPVATAALAQCLSATRRSLSSLELYLIIDPSNPVTYTVEEMAPILRAFGSLEFLNELMIEMAGPTMEEQVFNATLLTQLAEAGVVPPNLHRLRIDMDGFQMVPEDVLRAIAGILTAATSLEQFSLDLWLDDHLDTNAITTNDGFRMILGSLASHPSLRRVVVSPLMRSTRICILAFQREENVHAMEDLSIECHNILDLCTIVSSIIENNDQALKGLFVTLTGADNYWVQGHQELGDLLPQCNYLKKLVLHVRRQGLVRQGHVEQVIGNASLRNLLDGFKENKSLTYVLIGYLPPDSDASKEIAFYATRNLYRPALAQSPGADNGHLFSTFESMWGRGEEPELGLSVAFERLRSDLNWLDEYRPSTANDEQVKESKLLHHAGCRKRKHA